MGMTQYSQFLTMEFPQVILALNLIRNTSLDSPAKTQTPFSPTQPPSPACALELRVLLLPPGGGARTLLLDSRSTVPPKSYASLYVSEQPPQNSGLPAAGGARSWNAHKIRFSMAARANVACDRLLAVVLCVLATCSSRGDSVVRKEIVLGSARG